MIQSGTLDFDYQANADPTTGNVWNLHEGGAGVVASRRVFRSNDIAFSPPFTTTPHVVVSLAGIQAFKDTHTRVTLEVEDVGPAEFNIVVSTWDDSIILGVRVAWIAFD